MISIALKELLRQPRRFFPVGGALTLLVVLLVVLGGFLDGLESSQTGLYRAHEDSVIVYSDDANLQLGRSQVDDATFAAVEGAEGVDSVGFLDSSFAVARVGSDLEDIVLIGYDLSTFRLPSPPAAGEAVIDEQLQRETGVEVGDTITVADGAEALKVADVVDDLSTGAPSVWVSDEEWVRLIPSVNPGAVSREGAHGAVVAQSNSLEPADLARLLSREVDGVDAVTSEEAIGALDVVQQQSTTFAGIIGVTFVITLMVIALFFALITLERVRLYAVLKAIGGRTSELLAGVSVQAVTISLVALVLGFALSALFVAVLPPNLPIRVEPSRLSQIAIGTLVTAVLGSLFTARRIVSINPASAIG